VGRKGFSTLEMLVSTALMVSIGAIGLTSETAEAILGKAREAKAAQDYMAVFTACQLAQNDGQDLSGVTLDGLVSDGYTTPLSGDVHLETRDGNLYFIDDLGGARLVGRP
jgi:type II secretory pathway pseudopilin PulG